MNSFLELQRGLRNHIVDGDMALADSIDSSPQVSAAVRLKIYSDAYRLRLIEALQANYPILEELIGAEQFARLAQLYLAMHPSRHFSVRWFGHELAAFLCDCDEYSDQPWLAELAAWEWKVAAAFDARDASLLTVEEVARLAPDDWPMLELKVHPSVQRIGLNTNAAAIAKAAGNDEPLPVGVRSSAFGEWVIWRRDLIVRFRALDATEAAALDGLLHSENGRLSFGELCESIAQTVAIEAVPGTAAELLRRWIDDHLLVVPEH